MRHHVIDDANARGAMAASLGRWVVWTSRALQLQLLARRSDFRSWALCLWCLSVLDRIDTSSLCHCLRTVVGGYCTLFIDIHRVTGEEVWSHNTTTVLPSVGVRGRDFALRWVCSVQGFRFSFAVQPSASLLQRFHVTVAGFAVGNSCSSGCWLKLFAVGP